MPLPSVSLQHARSVLVPRVLRDFRWSWRTTTRCFNRRRYKILAGLSVVLLFCIFFLNRHDRAILDAIQGPAGPLLDYLTSELGKWGDFLCFNLLAVVVIWSGAVLGRARWLQRVAVASLMAAVLSGVACNVFRLTLGRARPNASVEDRFYGFPGVVKGWRYHSFPSGHTTTAVAGASAIGVSIGGPLGVGVVALSAVVAWERMYKNKHYPTDVLVGATLGCIYGFAVGGRLRLIRLRLDRMRLSRRLSRSEPISELMARDG